MNNHPTLIAYLLFINLAAIFVYGTDKLWARGNAWRVRETTLWLLALLGGSAGAIIAIKLFRHKTRKATFLVPLAVIILAQIILYLYLTA